ncbi:MAG: DUF177 domain-containing protein [Rhodospirillales bacterium]
MKSHNNPSGLHLTIFLADLRDEPVHFHIVATEAERQDLAQRFGLRALSALVADITVAQLQGGVALRVEGRLEADLTQACVVSLESVQQHIDDSFCLDFGEPADVLDTETGELLLAVDPNAPEPMPHGELDLGELLAEHLALAIDPYPRKPGVALDQILQTNGITLEAAQQSPFAVLSGLKNKR